MNSKLAKTKKASLLASEGSCTHMLNINLQANTTHMKERKTETGRHRSNRYYVTT